MDEGIAATVEAYLDGMILADEALTRRAFHPDGNVVGFEPAGLEWVSVDGFVEAVAKAGPQPGGRAAYVKILQVEQVGDIARVTLEDDYDGARYTDYLTMIRVGGEWRIVNKTFLRHSS